MKDLGNNQHIIKEHEAGIQMASMLMASDNNTIVNRKKRKQALQ